MFLISFPHEATSHPGTQQPLLPVCPSHLPAHPAGNGNSWGRDFLFSAGLCINPNLWLGFSGGLAALPSNNPLPQGPGWNLLDSFHVQTHTQVQLESSPARKPTFQVWGDCFFVSAHPLQPESFLSVALGTREVLRLNCLSAPGFCPRLVQGSLFLELLCITA